eukprot:COSAG02_NODE_662_length_18752_cov_10.146464_8_plen_87_part_00
MEIASPTRCFLTFFLKVCVFRNSYPGYVSSIFARGAHGCCRRQQSRGTRDEARGRSNINGLIPREEGGGSRVWVQPPGRFFVVLQH